MPLIRYRDLRFHKATLKQIEIVNAIIQDFNARGYELTLRQLYYQLVSRDIIRNSIQEYKKLGDMLNNARLAGMVDWNSIVDRTRFLRGVRHYKDAEESVQEAHKNFRIDKWEGQQFRPEVWIEKDALVGVIERVCRRNDVNYFSCRGYMSQSEMWQAGQRFKYYQTRGQTPVILHLGDHDPSGMHMTQDIDERLSMFMGGMHVNRIALNMDQIEEHDPPPNPAKETDSRFVAYADEHGTESWELDALDPDIIVGIVEEQILALRDSDKWHDKVTEENKTRTLLKGVGDYWPKIGGTVMAIEEGDVDIEDLKDISDYDGSNDVTDDEYDEEGDDEN